VKLATSAASLPDAHSEQDTQEQAIIMNGNQAHPSPEQQIELLKRQLAEAQKLTALGELISTTTHEFNNVLTSVINYAKMGLRHTDQPTRDRCFDKILAAGLRAAKITNGVLSMARNRSTSFEPTDLAKLADDTLLLMEREMRKYRIAIEKDIRPIPEAMVCGNQIQQVLLNLLINARQAMPDGGRIHIRLAPDPATGMIDLVVRDTGSGIAPDKLRRIFDPFFTTKSGPDATGKGGTGLGLSACRDIIESHRGRIRVESTVGKGTAFTIKLPACSRPAPGVIPAVSTSQPALDQPQGSP
jgi:signal transduction histidine kinase